MLSLIPWKKSLSPAEGARMLPLSSLRRELDPWFGPMFDGFFGEESGIHADPLRLEVRETDEHFLVRAEVPGLEPKDLDIQLQGDLLVISGEKRTESRDEREVWSYDERRYGGFRRAVRLSAPVDAERVQAEHKNGVVTIRLEKSAAARAKRIQVKAG